jgi:two-component sensor histidine kinase
VRPFRKLLKRRYVLEPNLLHTRKSERSRSEPLRDGNAAIRRTGILRALNERQELENVKRALEESGRQKDLLLKEVDHRVKNSLQVVSSMLHLQARTAGAAASQFNAAAARVAAIATVHQQLHSYDDVGTVGCGTVMVANLSDQSSPLLVNTVALPPRKCSCVR